ncbi:MAG TPA: DUF2167 domain-containing protein [Rhodanobacteraceae bacterium]|nr:DUF2167 domain-containing protein [Rhodanobacteraceae bacterium]
MHTLQRLAVAVSLSLACLPVAKAQDSAEANSVGAQIDALHWVKGPKQVTVGSNATFDVPAGYIFLGPDDSDRFMALTENLPLATGGTIFAPADFHWWATFEYEDAGHIKDHDAIDADAILASLREGQAQANAALRERGWSTLEVRGWKQAPFYDTDTRNLSWATDLFSQDNGETINYNTRLLSRTGYTAATLVVDPTVYAASISEFKRALQAYKFNPNDSYAAYTAGDKTAEYGLAALITGGAAAVATKTGFWKVIAGALAAGWKFVVAGVAALFAGVRKFLGRSRSET